METGIHRPNSARDLVWVDTTAMPDTFIVNIGDLMMRWTNDRWISTPHRVVTPDGATIAGSRSLSVGMFFIPHYDTEVGCLESCAGQDRPPGYTPISVTDYRTERFARTAGARTGG
jgi:isopenicillin N synthase-like dioxygenase